MMKLKKDDLEKQAKLRLLEKLSQEMSALMMENGEDEEETSPESMKEVTVAAPDKEGLEKGLDVAGKMLGKDENSLEALAGMHDMPDISLDDLDSEELMFEDEEDEE